MSVESYCNQEATLLRHCVTTDRLGACVRDWRPAGTLPIAIWQMSATERAINGSNGVDVTHTGAWVVRDDVAVTNEDRLQVNHAGQTRIFRVVFVENVQEMNRHVEAQLQEIKRDAS